MQERIRHEHQTPMFFNGFSVAHAILIQAQMAFTVLIKGFHLPDIMPPKFEAFTNALPLQRRGRDQTQTSQRIVLHDDNIP